jgi:hypothetical protein
MHRREHENFTLMAGHSPATVQLAFGFGFNPASIPAGTQTIKGWPAAVPVEASRWNTDAQPAEYRVASGDTLSGLAATYLGSPARWKEIWDMQPGARRQGPGASPDKIFTDEILLMPDEARDNLIAFIAAGKPTGKKPGELTTTDKTIAKVRTMAPWILGGAIAAYALYVVVK